MPALTVNVTEAPNAPSGFTVVVTVGLNVELMSTVVELEAGFRTNPAGPMVMNGPATEQLVQKPFDELALANVEFVAVLAAPRAATNVKTALAVPPAVTLTVCEVPGVTVTAPNGFE